MTPLIYGAILGTTCVVAYLASSELFEYLMRRYKRKKPARVINTVNGFCVAISKGSKDGVALGQRYLVYRLGGDLFDPETNECLGTLELVCAETVVVQVMPHSAILMRFQSPTGVWGCDCLAKQIP